MKDTHSAGAGESWRTWFDRHGGRLLLFARQVARCEHEAEDLVQEAFVAAWRACERDGLVLRPALVLRKIRLLAIDRARSEDRRHRREEEAPCLPNGGNSLREPDSIRLLEDREREETLWSAVNALPREQREVLTLKIWNELTFEEIARTLEIPQATAASRYRYALQALRRKLVPQAL